MPLPTRFITAVPMHTAGRHFTHVSGAAASQRKTVEQLVPRTYKNLKVYIGLRIIS